MLMNSNVGIGTTNPQAKLHVNGRIKAQDPIDNNDVATKAYVDAATEGPTYVFGNTGGVKGKSYTMTCPVGKVITGAATAMDKVFQATADCDARHLALSGFSIDAPESCEGSPDHCCNSVDGSWGRVACWANCPLGGSSCTEKAWSGYYAATVIRCE